MVSFQGFFLLFYCHGDYPNPLILQCVPRTGRGPEHLPVSAICGYWADLSCDARARQH